jgi:hypothetical protein
MPVFSKPVVRHALQPLDARRFVAGEKEAVADARDGGQVLMERVLDVAKRPPVGKDEIDLSDRYRA